MGQCHPIFGVEKITLAAEDFHRYYGYYGKRSADEAAPAESGPNANAEADPWYGYYGHRYGYHGYYGKRSAEPTEVESGPNADAEADPWYGYYGYAHRPYGYGYYGYRP